VEDVRLIVNLVMALGFAVVGGAIVQRLGLPTLIGYVLAGIVIGPATPGLDADRDRVILLANLGVAFLMFGLGAEFSFKELFAVRRVSLIAAAIQLPLTAALGFGVGVALGWDARASALLGTIFAISSSIVMIKLLLSRGEATSPQARIAVGLGVVQDLSLVPILALLPLLEGQTGHIWRQLGQSLGIAALELLIVVFVGTRLVPKILYVVARMQSRELFLLTIVVIALGTAYASHKAGLSLALGAFLAGLVISESDFDAQVLAEIIPIRDLFATIFFVSLGMLLDPALFLRHPGMLAFALAALVLGKVLITGAAMLVADVDPRTAVLVAVLLAQIGEFSFVLVNAGLDGGIIGQNQYGLVVAVALGSILVSPLMVRLGPSLVPLAERLPGVAGRERRQAFPVVEQPHLRRHVVICGYGRIGRTLGDALTRRGLRFTAIDINPAVVRDLQARGIPAYYGDAAVEALLRRARAAEAKTVAVTVPDLTAATAVIRQLRSMNKDVDIITRASVRAEVEFLRGAGANQVVQPEFEAGQEFVRHILREQGVPRRETETLLNWRRTIFYDQQREAALYSDDDE
jgi:CPA2 family monovalent cation:H+ antiporter-2